ncbi:rRNA maturation RNase YbeY [Thiohalocapsa marina]|uniref:Endoribonuclease YbeY n=1 Tax=Thiohalocapsa marina TaxID=424902 RepID=A0A5M8FLT5_9GAMM|nr:rRNA maturation RNase YbeY [Thiohalocapsa marina]KAA6184081.1 rRNA maturation RNase YbeY [Thiohalocapsa marina]
MAPNITDGTASVALTLDLQWASDAPELPSAEQLRAWAEAALDHSGAPSPAQPEMTIRIVDEAEGAELNAAYRGRSGATNVLSFPFELPPGLDAAGAADLPDLLGDLVICAPVVQREALQQGKPLAAHWAHMVVHGTLHLLGYDHIQAAEAARMEALETDILRRLGFSAPYEA